MGNQLVGIAPSQIFPVERYLTDYPDLKFDQSLGSTRFLKVARAESQEGLLVVKVFAIHDPSLPLCSHKDRLEEIRKKLSSAVNCIPFQRTVINDKAALIMREYVKYSLYDRISTRPFLTNIEKRWITFQILYALHQCHKVGVCHGDIKLENIMVTSWNWVLLVDFASFKPTFLPENNPADYSYFFDTSRRRTCYIAPERFVQRTISESNTLFAESPCDSGELTPSMDIFSAGCALLELWNELHIPFEYSQLLEYRSNIYSPEAHLNALGDLSLRNLISSMICLDPSKRLSAEDYLAQERGKLFPEYFFTFLQSYMLIFSSTPILSPDEKILRLKKDIANIFKFLGPVKHAEEIDEKCDSEKVSGGECEGLVLITSLVTSCIRGLHDCSSKLYSLEILLELANHASDETILDRILPYLMFLAHDNMARVKMSAINTITQCLDLVKKIPRSDANIFPEYILPGLAPLASDPKTCVRAAYAKNIAKLAEIAYKYLEQIQNDWYEQDTTKIKDGPLFSFELELQVLHEMIQQTVSSLLTDTQTIVKQTLMHNGITELCVFFGKQKANDVILSHMITYLNDKEDKELRGSFFECMIGVASFIGWHCSYILKPLLQQGLTDCSEFVAVKAVNAMSQLTDLGLISKPDLCELITESACFLVHPNLWIRTAIAGFISTAAKKLSVLDVQCKIMPKVAPCLKHQLIQIERPELLLNALVNPIPRQVYDSIVIYSEIDMVLDMLKDRKAFRDSVKTGRVISDFSKDVDTSLKNLLRRLEANGMVEETEEHVLRMGPFLKKISKHKTSADASHNKQNEGRIELSSTTYPVRSHVFNLYDSQNKNEFLTNRRLHRTNTSGSIDTNVNSDWNYSSEMLAKHSESTNSGGPPSRSTNSRPSSPPHDGNTPFISTDPSSNVSLHERSYIHYRRSSCYFELLNLKSRQQEHYFEALRNKEWAEQAAWQPQLPPPSWHLRGTLVAHLHEHKSAVNRLCTIPDTPLFASCSSDGYVRLWDCAKMEGKNIANRSRQHYKMSSNITGLTSCEGGQSLAAACEEGSINILRIDSASSKMSLVQSKQLDKEDEGFVVDLQCMESGSQSVLLYATLYGSLIGWDLRAPGTAFRLENGMKDGVITSFCVDPHQNWLAVGMNSNIHNVWDLRFHLKINSVEHPAVNSKVRKVICHPTEPSWILSSIHSNNEVSMWNLETRFREHVLWGSTAPPLSTTTPKNQPIYAVTSMLSGCIDRSPFVITGGTDQRVRFWNLSNPSQSYLAIPAASDAVGTTLKYESRLVDGTDVVQEQVKELDFKGDIGSPSTSRMKDKEDVPRAGPEPPPAGHRDGISDMTLCKSIQCFLVTSSRDGVIKVWK